MKPISLQMGEFGHGRRPLIEEVRRAAWLSGIEERSFCRRLKNAEVPVGHPLPNRTFSADNLSSQDALRASPSEESLHLRDLLSLSTSLLWNLLRELADPDLGGELELLLQGDWREVWEVLEDLEYCLDMGIGPDLCAGEPM